MGIYFIAAGTSSGNRKRTLDKSWSFEEVYDVFPQDVCDRVYLWGANEGSKNYLTKVHEREYVVDVENTEIIQIFEFCFWFKSSHTPLLSRPV